MGNPNEQLTFGVPRRSPDGLLYTRYPQGDAPNAVQAAGAGVVATAIAALATAGEPPEWQLPTDYYQAAEREQLVVSPRPDDETSSWARCRLAPSEVAFEMPIVILGGAPPHEYVLVQGPAGMSIGEHYGDEDYGVLKWSNPVFGSYEIIIRVRSQEYGRNTSGYVDESTITFSIAVEDREDTDFFIWLDAENGNDTTGDGSYSNPFKTLGRVYGSTSFGGRQLMLKPGTYNTNGSSQFVINAQRPAVIWGVGDPGDVVISYTQRNFALSTSDIFIGNVTLVDDGYGASQANPKCFRSDVLIHRFTAFKVHNTDPQNGTDNDDNPTTFYTSDLQSSTNIRQYVAFSRCSEKGRTGSGNSGQLHICYSTKYSVTEWCETQGSAGQGSCLYKGRNPDFTIRFCDFHETNINCFSIGCQDSGGVTGPQTARGEICYSRGFGTRARLNFQAYSGGGTISMYRCTVHHSKSGEQGISILQPDNSGPYRVLNCVVQIPGTNRISTGSNITAVGNLTGASGLVDSDGNLTEGNAQYLGKKGWQVGVPA